MSKDFNEFFHEINEFFFMNNLKILSIFLSNDFNEIFDVMKNGRIDLSVMTPTFMKLCLLNKGFNNINYPNFKC